MRFFVFALVLVSSQAMAAMDISFNCGPGFSSDVTATIRNSAPGSFYPLVADFTVSGVLYSMQGDSDLVPDRHGREVPAYVFTEVDKPAHQLVIQENELHNGQVNIGNTFPAAEINLKTNTQKQMTCKLVRATVNFNR